MSPVIYLGDEISLRPGETARAEGGISRALMGSLHVMSNNSGVVGCDETTWETGRGNLVLRNRGRMEVTVVLGDIVGAAWSAPGVGLAEGRMERSEKKVDVSTDGTSTNAKGSEDEASGAEDANTKSEPSESEERLGVMVIKGEIGE